MDAAKLSKLRQHAVRSMKESGLPIPQALPPITESQRFPVDLTVVHDRDLRSHLSFWAGQLARAEFVRARCEIEELGYKEARLRMERRFRLLNDFGTKWEADAALAENEDYSDIDAKYNLARAKTIGAKGLRDSFEHYYAAISRELSARINENDRDNRDRAQ